MDWTCIYIFRNTHIHGHKNNWKKGGLKGRKGKGEIMSLYYNLKKIFLKKRKLKTYVLALVQGWYPYQKNPYGLMHVGKDELSGPF